MVVESQVDQFEEIAPEQVADGLGQTWNEANLQRLKIEISLWTKN